MIRLLGLSVLVVALCSTGSSRARAQGDNRPGQPTASRVQILNRVATEAVPVRVFNGTEAVATTIVGVPAVTLASGAVVETRSGRQRWEYRRVPIVPGSDPTEVLNAAGAEGWDAVGLVEMGVGRSAVLMKRPR